MLMILITHPFQHTFQRTPSTHPCQHTVQPTPSYRGDRGEKKIEINKNLLKLIVILFSETLCFCAFVAKNYYKLLYICIVFQQFNHIVRRSFSVV